MASKDTSSSETNTEGFYSRRWLKFWLASAVSFVAYFLLKATPAEAMLTWTTFRIWMDMP